MIRGTKGNSTGASDAHKVLIIAHAFPPTGGSGVQRPAKFAKYLPEFGWRPMVWAADVVDGLPQDATLANELPAEALVTRIPNPDRVRRIATAFAGRVPSIQWRLTRFAASRFPDDAAVWARKSVKPLLRLIRREGIELIYSTFSPASNHWLALQLKHRTGLPWVADFRDLWTDDCRYNEPQNRRVKHRRLEDEILHAADTVIGVTPSQTALLAARMPGQQSKFLTITNGYDPADFDTTLANSPEVGPTNRFVLCYAGRLDSHRVDNALFAALRQFAQSLGSSCNQFVLRIVGHANETTRRRLRDTGVAVESHDYVSHAESIGVMRSADALLLLLPTGANAETIISAKVFEYLAARRPVLAIGPTGSETLRIVDQCHAGVCVQFDERQILRALKSLYESWNDGAKFHGCDPGCLARYSRIELTRQLAAAFEKLVCRATSRSAPATQLLHAGFERDASLCSA